MNHKKLSIEIYDEVLMFLDRSQKQYREKSESIDDNLDLKIAYYKKRKEIEKAHRTLLSLRFEMEDYVRTGKFEPGKIIL